VLQPSSLLDLTEKYHLLPFVLLFLFLGIATALAMAVAVGFRLWTEMVRARYESKAQCDEIRKQYAEGKLLGGAPR
jgi:hypothetical protein